MQRRIRAPRLLAVLAGLGLLMPGCAEEAGSRCPQCPTQQECPSVAKPEPTEPVLRPPTSAELDSLCSSRVAIGQEAAAQEMKRLRAELVATQPPPATSWLSRAQNELGNRDLLVECNDQGIRLVDPVTGRAVQTSKAPAKSCAVYPAAGALFFQAERREADDLRYDLYAQDLSAMEPPFLVLEGAGVPILMELGDWRGMGGDHNDTNIKVSIPGAGHAPTISFLAGNYCMVDEEECEAEEARARTLTPAPAADRLAQWLARDQRKPDEGRPLQERQFLPALPHVPKKGCEERDLCGAVTPIPGTHMQLVLMRHSCGDGCYVEYCLFDPVRGVFLDALKPTHWVGEVAKVTWDLFDFIEVSADGTRYVLGGCVRDWGGEFEYCCKGSFGGFLAGTIRVPE